jgi:hypothetical protein
MQLRLGCSDLISSLKTGVEAILTKLCVTKSNWIYAVSSYMWEEVKNVPDIDILDFFSKKEGFEGTATAAESMVSRSAKTFFGKQFSTWTVLVKSLFVVFELPLARNAQKCRKTK